MLSLLGGSLILFDFELESVAERVLQEGVHVFKQKILTERWASESGYLRGVQNLGTETSSNRW